MIKIQKHDFNLQDEYAALLQTGESGAVSMFVGLVRDFQQTDKRFFLEHYPGMTENVLKNIENQAHSRWRLLQTRIIHRIGQLEIDDQIVFVGASSAHREDAFAASQFMIDILKTQAPFWKKEGELWVEASKKDQVRANRW